MGAKIETPAYNVNRLCGSGIQALIDSKNMILYVSTPFLPTFFILYLFTSRGEADCVLAVGSENMSLAPHLTYGTRFGTRYEGFKVVDMLMDALTDAVCYSLFAL